MISIEGKLMEIRDLLNKITISIDACLEGSEDGGYLMNAF